MLVVTSAARNYLSKKLARKKSKEDTAMRFTRKVGGWKLRADRIRPKDTAIEYEGRKVLVLGLAVSKAMAHMTLDVKSTDAGPKLTLLRD